jgi:hypothetical protein
MKKDISWVLILVSFFTIMIGGITLASSIVFLKTKAKFNSVQVNNLPQSPPVDKSDLTPTEVKEVEKPIDKTPVNQANLAASGEEAASKNNDIQVFTSTYASPETEDNTNGSPSAGYPSSAHVRISALVDDSRPEQGYTTRLVVSGPKGGVVTAICPIKANPKTYYARLSYITGKAIIPIKTKDAYKGEKVVINITINYEEQDYKTKATFIVK